MPWWSRRRTVLDSTLEDALVAPDAYSRRHVGRIQQLLLRCLQSGERVRAVAVDIENLTGVVVVTDRRLLTIIRGVIGRDVALATVSAGRVRKLSSCSYAVRLEGPDVELRVSTEEGANRMLSALGSD